MALAPSSTPLRGVVEIAVDMGFAVNENNRSQLGKFVAKLHSNLAVKEKRLCNGAMRDIKCYPDCPEIRNTIKTFFS